MAEAEREIDEETARSVFQLLARERRARLLAERRMLWMRGELMRVNDSLDAHARRLSEQLRPLRREAETARGEAGRAADEAKIAGSRLHDAFEASPDGFAIYDANLRLVEANALYLAPFDELEEVRRGVTYRRVLELCADEGIVDIGMIRPPDWVEMVARRLDAEHPEPIVLQLWDGTCKRLSHRRTANGDLVSLAVDITQALQQEAELEEERHRAEAAMRAKRAFLSNMSHELRTPLGGILGMSQLLAEEGLTEDQREQLSVIQASGQALLAIVDDVLDMGRIEGERLALRREPFEPRAVVAEVERALRPWAAQRALTLETEVSDAVPVRLVGDAARVRQVLLNLAGNAVKFTDEGRVSVRLEETGRPAPGVSRLSATVEDTGMGIAEADLDRVFRAFEQVETDRSRSHDGAGLGLTVTQRLVSLMGGRLRAESELGRGSCFSFTVDLPVAGGGGSMDDDAVRGGSQEEDRPPAGAEATDAPAPTFGSRRRSEATDEDGAALAMRSAAPVRDAKPEAAGSTGDDAGESDTPKPGGRSMRVLAAEDNRANRLILTRMLAGLAIDLTVVEDGVEAVEAFERERPDLILMDISMPRMDGIEATRRIRAMEEGASRVPIVAVTAHALAGDEESFRAAGIDGYLPKPVRREDLRGIVASHAPAEARPPDAETD